MSITTLQYQTCSSRPNQEQAAKEGRKEDGSGSPHRASVAVAQVEGVLRGGSFTGRHVGLVADNTSHVSHLVVRKIEVLQRFVSVLCIL